MPLFKYDADYGIRDGNYVPVKNARNLAASCGEVAILIGVETEHILKEKVRQATGEEEYCKHCKQFSPALDAMDKHRCLDRAIGLARYSDRIDKWPVASYGWCWRFTKAEAASDEKIM